MNAGGWLAENLASWLNANHYYCMSEQIREVVWVKSQA
jgi:hypothetical protein